MTEFIAVREIETDLRQVIVEASSRKTIPHVRDRAERAVASILMISDGDSLILAIDEVLSTLLIATEVGFSPKLIILSLSILQKLAASNSIRGATFLHMITVLCKSASSLSAVLPSPSGPSAQTEVEIAQLRCLQTLHLLQVKELRALFLDEIALSQILGMCVNLVSNPTSSAVVIQSAQGAISQLYLFVLDSTLEEPKSNEDSDFDTSEFKSTGQGVLEEGLTQISDPKMKPLFMFLHDLVTMSSPIFTRHIACTLFGSGRISPQLCIDMLSLTFSPSTSQYRWPSFMNLIVSNHLLPLISKTVAEYLEMEDSGISLTHFRQTMRLFLAIIKGFPINDFQIESLLVQFNNFLIQEPNFSDPFNRALVTELCTLCICSRPGLLQPAISGRTIADTPFGGDSPVRKSQAASTCATEAIVESVCMHLHSISGEIGASKISFLFSSCEHTDHVPPGDQGSVSLDLLLAVIDTAFKSNPADHLIPVIASTWTALLSCLILVISQSSSGPSSNVLNAVEQLLTLLALANHKEGMHASISAVLKQASNPLMKKFILNMFHRVAQDEAVLSHIGTVHWAQILKLFEIFSSAEIKNMSSDELAVQNIALDTFFHCPPSLNAVDMFVTALCSDPSGVSAWTFHRLGQLLTAPLPLDLATLWIDKIDPLFSESCRSVSGAYSLVQTVVTQFPSLPVAQLALASAENLPRNQPSFSEGGIACMLAIAENCGYLLSNSCWKSIVSITIKGLPNPKALKLAELAIDDLTDQIEPELPRLIEILSATTLGSVGENLPVTSAFKAINLAMKSAESLTSKNDEGWDAIDRFFKLACTDRRAEVRNCALKTLVGIPFSPTSTVVAEIALEVVVQSAGSPGSPSAKAAGVAIVHHSRDTEEKRWSESVVLALHSVTRKSYKHLEIIKCIFDRVIVESGVTDEVLAAACKTFVDIWKLWKFEPEKIFFEFLETETTKIRNPPFRIGKIASLLIPALMAGIRSFETVDPSVENIIFNFIAATLTCPSLHEEAAVAFSNASPAVSSVWSSPICSPVEIEAFRPAVEWNSEDNMYKPLRLDANRNVPSYIWSVFTSLSFFTEQHVVDLFLNLDVLFLNSLTVQFAACAIAAIENNNNSLPDVLPEAIEKIAKTRCMSIGIASTGLWKLAVQTLVRHNACEPLFRLLDQINSEDADVVDYSLAIACLNRGLDDILLQDFIKKELSGGLNKYRNFLLFSVLTAVLGFGQNSLPGEQAIFSVRNRENESDIPDLMPSLLGRTEMPETIIEEVVGYMRLLLLQQEPTSVCALMTILCDKREEAEEVQKMLVGRIWDLLAGPLVVCDSGEIRAAVSRLLIDVGPPYPKKF